MSYSGLRPTRPRSVLVIVGGLIAWAGLVGGVLVATPEYHRALTMKTEPVSMTWQSLAENGLTDNSYVRLIGVELDREDPSDVFDQFVMPFDELGPDATPEEQQAAFEQFAMEPWQMAEIAEMILRPIKVIPQGVDAGTIPAHIVVPPNPIAMEAALREVEEEGTLTGRFTPGSGESIEALLAGFLIANTMPQIDAEGQGLADDNADVENPFEIESEAEGENQIALDDQTDGNEPAAVEDPFASEIAQPEIGSERVAQTDAERVAQTDAERVAQTDAEEKGPAVPQVAPAITWVYEPVETVPNLSEAQQWFWIAGFAVVVGMVICGAGGPSITCCVLFQCPSILSLFGYPLRYGRGSKTTRIVYACIGIGLLVFGYQKMITEGQFGQIHSDLALSAMGFVAGSLGAAALFGAGTNALAHKLNVSLDPSAGKRNSEPAMSMREACSLEPTKHEVGDEYIDPALENEDCGSRPEELDELADSLVAAGFDQPVWMTWSEEENQRPAMIHLGCQEMVIAEAEQFDGRCQLRLVSVLQDGLAIVTLSGSKSASHSSRFGSSGMYFVHESDDPVTMLSTHLDQTVSMAKKRDTAVVAIDASEMADAILFARRALTDIRAQYGEESAEVGAAIYGRFSFPVKEVSQFKQAVAEPAVLHEAL